MHLVVGFPGPVAKRLVTALCEREERVCLVAPHVPRLPHGVTCLKGDTSDIDFGLSGAEYTRLLQEVRHVYLADAQASGASGLESSPIVRQAAEVQEFVQSGGAPDGVTCLSSLLVFGDMATPVSEADFDVGQGFADDYERSLAVAEKMIRGLASRVPVSVVRTAPVVADEEEGTLIESGPLARLARELESAVQGFEISFTDSAVRFETVGRATAALLENHPQAGLVVSHLVDLDPPTDRQLIEWLAARSNTELRETARGSRTLTSWIRPQFSGDRALRGWPLAFARTQAEKTMPQLLDRDDFALLERLFPSTISESTELKIND